MLKVRYGKLTRQTNHPIPPSHSPNTLLSLQRRIIVPSIGILLRHSSKLSIQPHALSMILRIRLVAVRPPRILKKRVCVDGIADGVFCAEICQVVRIAG